MSDTRSSDACSEVVVIEHQGEFHVAVREVGGESIRAFESRVYAESYADGQRMRLGLPGVTRRGADGAAGP